MRTSLATIVLSAALTSCMPKKRIVVQTSLTRPENKLLVEYNNHNYGSPDWTKTFNFLISKMNHLIKNRRGM